MSNKTKPDLAAAKHLCERASIRMHLNARYGARGDVLGSVTMEQAKVAYPTSSEEQLRKFLKNQLIEE